MGHEATLGGGRMGGHLIENSHHCPFAVAARKFLATCLANCRNWRTTGELSLRRVARFRGALSCVASLKRRKTTPTIFIRCIEAVTMAIPRPADTSASLEILFETTWPIRGLKPAVRQAAISALLCAGKGICARPTRMKVSPASAFK